jgi:hypothetical protein
MIGSRPSCSLAAPARLAAASLLLPALASCAKTTVPRLVEQGRLGEACVALDPCKANPDACREITAGEPLAALDTAVAVAAAKRSGAAVEVHALDRDELSRRLGFEVAADHAGKALTLAVTVSAAGDDEIPVGFRRFWLEGMPDLEFREDDARSNVLASYVAALGGPLEEAPVLPDLTPSSCVHDQGPEFIFHLLTLGVALAAEVSTCHELAAGFAAWKRSHPGEEKPYVDPTPWPDRPAVRAAAALRDSHRYDSVVHVPAGSGVTFTRGYVISAPLLRYPSAKGSGVGVEVEFELAPGCRLPYQFSVSVPDEGKPREVIGALAARGAVPLALATPEGRGWGGRP